MTDIVELLRKRAARKWTDVADRSASLFGQAADEIKRLRDERDALRAALVELVACKDLIDSIPASWQVAEIDRHEKHGPRYADYKRRKPLAWAAARAAIDAAMASK